MVPVPTRLCAMRSTGSVQESLTGKMVQLVCSEEDAGVEEEW